MRVFISHSSDDRGVAEGIARELERIGVEPFMYEEDSQLGTPLAATLSVDLAACDDVLVVLTAESLDKRWLSMEVGAAIALKKRLVLVRMSSLKASSIPQEFGVISIHHNDIQKLYYDKLKTRVGAVEKVQTDTKVFELRATDEAPKEELSKSVIAELSKAPVDNATEMSQIVRDTASLFPTYDKKKES